MQGPPGFRPVKAGAPPLDTTSQGPSLEPLPSGLGKPLKLAGDTTTHTCPEHQWYPSHV